MTRQIPFASLNAQYQRYKDEIDTQIQAVLDKGAFIMGPFVNDFEAALSDYTGAKHAISCASGTDALMLALMALDIEPGDEVITTPFTFIATGEMIAFLRAVPVFVDIDPVTYNIDPSQIEAKITNKTKAIIPVSLYGQPADMDAINAIGSAHNIPVIEDAAQSFGAEYKGKKSCNLSDMGCTSFFPAKPLGCFGDGGAIFLNDDATADKIRSLRNHGQTKRYHHEYIGVNGRMDAIQCAITQVKLKYYEADISRRVQSANAYSDGLKDIEGITLPTVADDRTSVFAQYSIRLNNRTDLIEALKEDGVPTAVHYPIPLHMQPAFSYLGLSSDAFPVSKQVSEEIMSLPICADLSSENQAYIIEKIQKILG